MNCCCDKKEQAITIVKGNDTNANGTHLLSIYLTDPLIDLSQATATFTLCGITQTFDDLSEGVIYVDYTNKQTSQMPVGINYGTLNILENGNIISTLDNMIAFNVVKNVHGDALGTQPYHYTFDVKQSGETILNVSVEAGVSVEVGSTETLPPGSEAYVQNVGTPNHIKLKFGIPEGEKGEDGDEGPEGPEGPAGKDAKINGVNTLTLKATNGVQLNQSGDTANIDGKPLQDGISDINSKIPSSASSSNKLADVDFVNSSINNMAAFYVTSDVSGDPFPTRASLVAGPWYFRGQTRQPTQNDYALVTEDETHDDMTSRFMYDGTQWVWQYTLNNTQFTQAQIDAINSGITESLVNKIGQNESNITTLQNTKQDNINDLATIRSGAAAGATAVQPNQLGTAAYENANAFATSAQGSKADSALQGVQINGADLTPDTNQKVNIPLATNSDLGVARANQSFGTYMSNGTMCIWKASGDEIVAKTQNYKPIVPSLVDKAVMEGLGNNALTWTDAYKASARNTIGAEAQSTIQTLSATDSITLADNTIYNGGEQTALTIALPATDTIGFICDVDFSSGNTATTLSYSLPDIFWEGVDVAYDSTAQKNIFTPVANKRYTIIFYYDGVNYNGRVGGVYC